MLGIHTTPKENLNTPSAEMTHGTPKSSVPNDLHMANFVFVRRDTRRKPLQSPYDGPYQVIHPGNKTFQLLIGEQDTVSIDILKPAHLDINSPVQVAQSPNRGRPRQITPSLDKEQSPKNRVTTRLGRTIKTPSRFQRQSTVLGWGAM
uniref:Uncharacterized protein n=1 Tax=Octopus bimaculoides TaxID=37653 RepID=A0A0L8GNG9_OCTBM